MTKGLSKSKYTLYNQCQKALWLRTYKPDEATVDAAVEARFEQGNEVGDLAMGLFGPFVEVTTKREDGSLDLGAMIEKTQQEMANGTAVICEASFSFENNYCAVDILRKDGNGWTIYEVKSSSFPEFDGEQARLEKYAPDIAYQKWVLEQCGVNVKDTYLVCLNSNYVRHGELDIEQLFVTINMKELVENEYQKVPSQVQRAMLLLENKEEPDVDLSEHCAKPYGCAFLNYCKRQHGVPQDKPSVFDLYRMPFGKKLEHYHAGRITFEQLRDQKLNDKQQMQVECTLGQTEHVDKEGIRGFLNKLYYPLYFLDFETMQDAVPKYDGAKVYGQITFQYSLHVKERESISKFVDAGRLKFTKTATFITHREFLAPNDGSDPRRPLAEQLCKDIPMDACTLAYNKMFECGRIRELAALYPDLAPHLLNIADHIIDLIEPFRAGYYYVPAMGGSFSIKSVLPALFPDDPELDYHHLDARVQNGGDAMAIFPRLTKLQQSLPKQGAHTCVDGKLVMADSHMSHPEILAIQKEIDESREALLRYCELDTWAMVKVWEKLFDIIKR